jgi:succinate-acetate transporter protein
MNDQIRWCSLNRENLKIFDVMSLVLKNPFKLQFTSNVSVNYQLGVKVIFCWMVFVFLIVLSSLSSSSILHYVFSFVYKVTITL